MKMSVNPFPTLALCTFLLTTVGCSESPIIVDPNELITALTLTFLPTSGGTAITALSNDADGDGGKPPTVEPIVLPAGTYDLQLKFENRLENPPEDINAEISGEGDEHQVFFTGTAVSGPASNQANAPLAHSYADVDAKGLPLGLQNKVMAAAGTGTLTVNLRHMPPINNMPVKTASAGQTVQSGGIEALGGGTDLQANFTVTVN